MLLFCLFFFFNDTATTEIYTLSLHDALPIWRRHWRVRWDRGRRRHWWGDRRRHVDQSAVPDHRYRLDRHRRRRRDRKSTRLNSSHSQISYAVFCLKKKKKTNDRPRKEQMHEC